MLSILSAKGLVLAVLFVMTFTLGLIPVRLMTVIQRSVSMSGGVGAGGGGVGGSGGEGRRPKLALYKRVLSFLSCFAAGVFLATCFLDLLPGVRKKLITVLFKMNIITGFPLAEFIMSVGLFFILIVEQVVLLFKETGSSSRSRTGSSAEDRDVRKPLLGNGSTRTKNKRSRGDSDRGAGGSDGGDIEGQSSEDSDGSHEFLHSDHSIGGITDQPDVSSVQDVRPRSQSSASHSHHNHHHHHHHDDLQSHSPLRALMLVVALSLHSVFEGLAVGLQSSTGQVLGIFGALVLHKSILSFSIGLSLVQSRLSLAVCLRSILFFSLTAPVGVGMGMVITYFGASSTSDLADGVLTGIASGTFLYMTFFEVLPAEFNNHHDRMLKLLMLLIGFGTVTGILFLSDDVKAPFCKISVHD